MSSAKVLTVLVVEDHDFQRRTIMRMLRSLGASDVIEAAEGKQALMLMNHATHIDLVVCDLDMPKMDGMEFLRHLAELKVEASVIITSAKDRSLLTSVEKMARAYGIRLIGVIEKPVTRHSLADLISRHRSDTFQTKQMLPSAPRFTLEEILYGVQQKQFEPFFQAKVDFATGQILGAEALARWCHPAHGLISPDAFIAPLEHSGNINDLTYLMLEMAGIACRHWHEQGYPITVSVNLSLRSLTDTMLADKITHIIQSTQLDPSHMILEITETVAMTDIAPVLENLTRLRMRGFGLSIDDYGTGFSSMQQLLRIPYTELKIDQSFVMGCAGNTTLLSIVKSSIDIARQLGIKTVAEGVETQADWEILKTLGCDVAQGYFIAKPMAGNQFLAFCRSFWQG